jgi:hypothetical protein
MQIQIDPYKFYRGIIGGLERHYTENDSQEAVWKKVSSEIALKLKLDITFDSRFS